MNQIGNQDLIHLLGIHMIKILLLEEFILKEQWKLGGPEAFWTKGSVPCQQYIVGWDITIGVWDCFGFVTALGLLGLRLGIGLDNRRTDRLLSYFWRCYAAIKEDKQLM